MIAKGPKVFKLTHERIDLELAAKAKKEQLDFYEFLQEEGTWKLSVDELHQGGRSEPGCGCKFACQEVKTLYHSEDIFTTISTLESLRLIFSCAVDEQELLFS